MKRRIIAGAVIAAAAITTLAGCSGSITSPLAFNSDSCDELGKSMSKQIDGLSLEKSSKIGDDSGTCTWSHSDGRSVTLSIKSSDVVVGVGTSTFIEKFDKEHKGENIETIANKNVKTNDMVLHTAAGTEGDESRKFTADGDGNSVTVSVVDVPVSNKEAGSIFGSLLAG